METTIGGGRYVIDGGCYCGVFWVIEYHPPSKKATRSMQFMSLQKQVPICSLKPRLQEAILMECLRVSICPRYSQSIFFSQYSSFLSSRYRKQQFSSKEQYRSWLFTAPGSLRKQFVRQGIHRLFFSFGSRCDRSTLDSSACRGCSQPSSSQSSCDMDSRSKSCVSWRMSLGCARLRKCSRMYEMDSNSRSGRNMKMSRRSSREQLLSLTSLTFSSTRLRMSILRAPSMSRHSMILSSSLSVYFILGWHSLTASQWSTRLSMECPRFSSYASLLPSPLRSQVRLATMMVWMRASLPISVGFTNIVLYFFCIWASSRCQWLWMNLTCSFSDCTYRCLWNQLFSMSRNLMKSSEPFQMEKMMRLSMKLTNRLEQQPCSLRIKAISASSSRMDLGRMTPSSKSTFSTEDSATMKYSSKGFFCSCSLMQMLNQSLTDFQKYFSLMLQLWRLRKRILHSLRLQMLYLTYWRTVSSELRQTMGMLKMTLFFCTSKQSLNSSTLRLYLQSPKQTPKSSSYSSSYLRTNSVSMMQIQVSSLKSPRSTSTFRNVPMQMQSSGSRMPAMIFSVSCPNSEKTALSRWRTLQTWFIWARSTIFSLRLRWYLSSRLARRHMNSMLVSLWMLQRSLPNLRLRQETSWLLLADLASTQLLYSVPSCPSAFSGRPLQKE